MGPQAPPTRGPPPAAPRARRPARGSPTTGPGESTGSGTSVHRRPAGDGDNGAAVERPAPGAGTEALRSYKTQTNFVDVVPQKRRLLLSLNMRFDELSDPRGLAADITNLGRWGNGDVQVELDNERQITCAMELVRQAFAAKQPGGDTPAS